MKRFIRRLFGRAFVLTALAPAASCVADGPGDNVPGSVRPIPPPGTELAEAVRQRLIDGAAALAQGVIAVAFLTQRLGNAGEITPPDTLVLHPYGRYSNAFKFAGEVDVLEAIAHVRTLFPIDENRIVIRGFSMGGAGCWQFAVHHPGTWLAATPGAGFA